MNTALRIEQANCPNCFNDTLDALARIEGVREVHGSVAGPCLDIVHDDVPVDVLLDTVRDRLHGIKMYASEVRMVPVDPVEIRSATCPHAARHAPAGRA